jgi:quercetin dioxygenase-like cupin family protein
MRRKSMDIKRANARPTKLAPEASFTGQVWQDPVMVGAPPSRMRATNVSFSPGARTAWHAHPVGQTLYCVTGVGRVQLEGERVQELHPGDTALIPPDTRHWHGASPDRLFIHLAMSEVSDTGEGTAWFEKVSDADYNQDPEPV